ncbi:hypothetical protein PCASD_01171 [Puccinia coronata f. sp. avenae]|uniref:Uncharacterized protein n=1 Tax=Puccinia coronata f. sp. avenae TaxID=200324 RepID=A0A2N5VLJ8_9BASI|nr:hypothetical protein PCASD_11018 [Puccinia coronata f. sp. avenae]PLW50830.1 hypothetical protein PCASD_01171 [Puccinia coronata f. sp. avenae]
MSSSQAATHTTTTAPAKQSGLPNSLAPVAPVFVQSDLPSRSWGWSTYTYSCTQKPNFFSSQIFQLVTFSSKILNQPSKKFPIC